MGDIPNEFDPQVMVGKIPGNLQAEVVPFIDMRFKYTHVVASAGTMEVVPRPRLSVYCTNRVVVSVFPP